MKTKRYNTTGLILFLNILSLSVMGQQRHAMSAKETVDYALKNSVQVKNALIGIQLQMQSNREITASAYPQIDGSVNVTDFLSIPTNLLPGEFFGQPAGTYIPVKFGTKYNSTYGLNLRQILFDGQVFVGLQARSASIKYAEQNVAVTQEQIKANVYKVYYQLVVGRNQIKLIDANIERAEKLLHDTKELFKNGFQEKLDVDKVNVTLSNLKTDRTRVDNQLQTGNLALKYLMGMPVKDELQLTDSLRDSDLRDNLLNNGNFNYEDRVEYQLLQTAARLGEFNVKRYKMSYYPGLSLTGGYNRNAQRNKFNFLKISEPWFTTSFFGIGLAVPIFDGFAKDARIKQAKLQLQQTQNNIANLENSINNDMQTAKVQVGNALLNMDEQKKNMALSEQVYNQTKLKYEQGLGSNLEVTNAETDMVTSQNNYFSAVYDAIIARIDYLKAIGKL
jgi:outer membrane protein